MKSINKDTLIELLNSEDIESRKLGINILKNNYNYPLTIYTNKKIRYLVSISIIV